MPTVAILQEASIADRKRLLELFPISILRSVWAAKGTKEEICYAAAAPADYAQIERVINFVDEHLNCCKQHLYVYGREADNRLPPDIIDGEKVKEVEGSHALYLCRVSYNVVLREPLEETTLEFLWPVRVELKDSYLVVRFVVLERNPSSYLERDAYVSGKSLNEKIVLPGLVGALKTADINKGIKKLWADGVIESTRSNFKKPYSLSSETMDEEKGIKEHYPDVYAMMQESPLYTTIFEVTDKKSTVSNFSADPSHGIIGFGSYSEKGGTDGIIQQILANN
jgi:hypothetical protein